MSTTKTLKSALQNKVISDLFYQYKEDCRVEEKIDTQLANYTQQLNELKIYSNDTKELENLVSIYQTRSNEVTESRYRTAARLENSEEFKEYSNDWSPLGLLEDLMSL